jgi:GNAT superfamily N-acetyltransferase
VNAARAGQGDAVAVAAGPVVREATLADLDAIVALRLALLREHAGDPVYGRLHPDAESRAPSLFAQQIASPADVFLLTAVNEAPVGLLRCTESRTSPLLLPERYGYVSSVYVVPEMRRRGILRAMLKGADEWCRTRGIGEMRLHNVPVGTPAAAAWEALGFGIVEHVRARRVRGA